MRVEGVGDADSPQDPRPLIPAGLVVLDQRHKPQILTSMGKEQMQEMNEAQLIPLHAL